MGREERMANGGKEKGKMRRNGGGDRETGTKGDGAKTTESHMG